MIRVVIFLVVIAAGAAWLANQPGQVAITWHGLQIVTSLAVAAVALVAVLFVAFVLGRTANR